MTPRFRFRHGVDACGDQGMQRRWYLGAVGQQAIAVRAWRKRRGASAPRVLEHTCHLDRVQRDAIGPAHDLARGSGRRSRREVLEQPPYVGVRELLEMQAGKAAQACAPVRAQLEQVWTCQGHGQQGQISGALNEVGNEVQQTGIGPMSVIKDHADCRPFGNEFEQP